MKKLVSILSIILSVGVYTKCHKPEAKEPVQVHKPKFKEWQVISVKRNDDGSGEILLKKYQRGVGIKMEYFYECLPDTLRVGIRIDDPSKSN